MPKIDEATKLRRLERLDLLLTRNARGLTEAEIAEELGLERRSVNNYLRELEDRGKVFKDGLYWFPLTLKEGRLRSFDLSPEEAVTLYLGARLLAKQHDKRNEPAETALLKLAGVLKADAGVGDEIEQAARELASRPAQEGYQPIFREVVRGYIYRRKIVISYRPLNWNKPFETTFSTYLIEPSPIGFATYLIGHSSAASAVRAYKLERIESARLTREGYALPPDFPGLDILRTAWSIVMGEDTQRVVLRFSPQVRRRVLETRWHPSQATVEDPEKPGWLRWQVQVADTLDMLPWVRGWGADCEVLEPETLRKALEREVKRMAEVYRIVIRAEITNRFYAHTKDGADESEWQPLIEHLTRVADYAAEFGRDAGVAELARAAGMIHDLGKYSKEFQARLRGAKIKVDHATAGAKEVLQVFEGTPQQPFATLLAYCVSGHHTGLLDYGNPSDLPGDGTLTARLKTDVCDYGAYKGEVDIPALALPQRLPIRPLKGQLGFSLSFLTRMIYSALVDADFQETEEFMQGKKPRGGHEDIPTLRDKLNAHLRQFENPTSDINRKRTATLRACVEKSAQKPGCFKLTVPTGGGKTLASMAFALNHAATHGMKRIIYVIPFTTIIEQNAGVFKEVLGEENVLEHHSNFDWETKKREAGEQADDRTRSVYAKLKLAAENWDIPIVVTTNVQFFESLFANRSSRCRKLHNLAKSVIVFDEAQMFPRDYLRPAMSAVWELVTNYGASAVFCTATQPNLERFLPAGTPITELAPNPQDLFEFYKRVEVKPLAEKLPDDE
jgi:CRISPR-associated endonuclease/helicase Cas3